MKEDFNFTEANKLFAIFMGYESDENKDTTDYGKTFFSKDGKRFLQPQSFKYHLSWDWLMPVWIKASKLDIGGVTKKTYDILNDFNNTEIIFHSNEKKYGFYYNTKFDTLRPETEIESAYLALYRLLLWLKENDIKA